MGSLLDTSHTLLLVRKTAEGFINYSENTAIQYPANLFAKKNSCYSKSSVHENTHKSIWNNTNLAIGNLGEEIAHLKKQNSADIFVSGGAGFVSSLIKEGLIDEYHLIINPTAISAGMTIFNSFDGVLKVNPTWAKFFQVGNFLLMGLKNKMQVSLIGERKFQFISKYTIL